MPLRPSIIACLCLLSCLLVTGCNSNSSENQDKLELPSWLTEGEATGADSASEPLFPTPQSATLGLRLKPGDRFPLRKVVEQELRQEAVTGQPQVSRSRLELMFAITVMESVGDRVKLGVRYDRVKYQHQVADDRIEYDSTRPPAQIPLPVRAYHDMVNDGFAFWIGADNQIVDVEGLEGFLERCLKNVPPEHRSEIAIGIEAGSGETGIANFVDNSIGLLPVGKTISPGDSWQQQQHLARPIPMYIDNQYTLKELRDQEAVIDIRGSIAPSSAVTTIDNGKGVKVKIDGGETLGSCVIFRETGLPKQSRVDRNVQMSVVMSDVIQFRQTKRVTTTIESFPVSSSDPQVISWREPEQRPQIRRSFDQRNTGNGLPPGAIQAQPIADSSQAAQQPAYGDPAPQNSTGIVPASNWEQAPGSSQFAPAAGNQFEPGGSAVTPAHYEQRVIR